VRQDHRVTFSIVAMSADGSAWGVAVAGHVLAVGATVPAVQGDVGALAVQGLCHPTYRARGLRLLTDGLDAAQVTDTLLGSDADREHRQVGLVCVDGESVTVTGSSCVPWAGGVRGTGYAIQGEHLAGPQVVQAMQQAWLAGDPQVSLQARLHRALTAGEQAGGDSRGRQSAAVLVRSAGAAGCGETDLRVDDHPDAVRELGRLLDLHVPLARVATPAD
jgi:uncharacterized Ntn-hydrolase superfamily protein